MERNDRDDVSFEMSFDYEFVEDFYVDRAGEKSQATPTPETVTNVPFTGDRRQMRERLENEEEGEAGVIELKEVKVVTENEEKEEKVEEEKEVEDEDEEEEVGKEGNFKEKDPLIEHVTTPTPSTQLVIYISILHYEVIIFCVWLLEKRIGDQKIMTNRIIPSASWYVYDCVRNSFPASMTTIP